MPTPKTIEELLKIKPCPFEDWELVTPEKFTERINLMDATISEYIGVIYEVKHFKMPDGYFHLPPDKQLGLPLGEWTFKELQQLIDSLPYGVLIEYVWDKSIANNVKEGRRLHHLDYSTAGTVFNIIKQPPNLYNPLDQQVEAPPVEPEKPRCFSFMQAVERTEPVWYYDFNLKAYKSIVARASLFSVDLSNRKGKGIWADNPTPWLEWKTQQEGN